MTHAFATTAPFTLTVLSAALLIACGGGGNSQDNDSLSNETATSYAANAGVVAGDAASALDTALLTTSDLAVASGSAQSAAASRKQALSVTTPELACAGGGTATLSITNAAAPLAELNGRLDAGEVYVVSFSNCRRISGGAALNGALTMTVDSTTNNRATVIFTTTTLGVTLPRGTVAFNGSATVQRSATTTNGSTEVDTRVTSGSLAITTQFNGRTGQFTLSDLDLTRQATYVGEMLQSALYNGTHTLTVVLPNLSYNYTVATQGGAAFGADGLPTQGGWRITLPRRWITITIASGIATIAIDEGKDGSVERTFTVPVAQLGSDAG